MRMHTIITGITLTLALAAYSALAGSMTPAGLPSAGSGMPTTKAIFQQLSSGQVATSSSSFQGPSAGPGASGRSMKEIAAKLPVADNVNGATAADVKAGKSFWGLRTDGTWGGQNGGMPNNGVANFTPGAAAVPVTAGYYSGGQVNTDANLASGNIKAGATIFGVAGSANVVDTTEATAPATAANIIYGKKAFVNGALVTGTFCPGTLNGTRWCNFGNGTVRDNITGLIWLQDANWGGNLPWNETFDKVATVKHGTPDTLTDGSAAGDWRMPTKAELVALTSGTEAVRSGTPRAFTSVQAYSYWSGSESSIFGAWGVNMINGFVYTLTIFNNYYVIPVRSGQ